MPTQKKASTQATATPAAEVVTEAVVPAPAKKRAAPKKAAETAAVVEATDKKPNTGFMKPWTPSTELAAVVGKKALPRTEVTKKIWAYIKKHKLQDETDKRKINADKKLKAVFGKDQVTMFEMSKLISPHLKS